MEFGALKPLLTAVAMPPLSLLLVAVFGLLLAIRHRRTGLALVCIALALLWTVSCNGTAVWLARHALPQFTPTSSSLLKQGKVQAVVVLGGGMLPDAPEYGQAQPGSATFARMRYGIWLARQANIPLAFTGGNGWGTAGDRQASEADVTARVALQDYGFTPRWLESRSRDTSENAKLLAPLLQQDGVVRIALVTDSWHMPRSILAFEKAGLIVTPAPIGYVLPAQSGLMEWLPSASGLSRSQQILKEWLGILTGRVLNV